MPTPSGTAAADAVAGWLALAAGLCWFTWAIVNVATAGELDRPTGPATALVGASLTAGWSLLLIPAALRMRRRFRGDGRLLGPATVAGVLSMTLWAVGGVVGNSRPLETTYLALAAAWLVALGLASRSRSPRFGAFTLVVGAFTALDFAFNLFEPIPFALYLLASPKLPLSAAWSVTAGVSLIRREPAPRTVGAPGLNGGAKVRGA